MRELKTLSPKARRLHEQLMRLACKGMLEVQITTGGQSAALDELLRAGLADMGPATTMERSGVPAAAVFARKVTP